MHICQRSISGKISKVCHVAYNFLAERLLWA
jgi:hypothetical protein